MEQDRFYQESDVIFDKSYSDWVVKWWQSFLYADWRRRLSKVFMVTGKMETQDITHRTFKSINHKKAILVPIINWVGFNLMQAKAKMDVVAKTEFEVLLDQEENIGQHYTRILTPYFNLFGQPHISDGYWLFFKPDTLKKGMHTLSSSASCSSGKTTIAISYSLGVK